MTSIGIEWETNVCIFDKDQELKPYSEEHVPFKCVGKENDCGWQITLEKTKVDCLYAIETQIGVSYEKNAMKFNRDDICKKIDSFTHFWETSILGKKEIDIKEKMFPLVPLSKIDCKNVNIIPITYGYGIPQITFGMKLEYIPLLFETISFELDNLVDRSQMELFMPLLDSFSNIKPMEDDLYGYLLLDKYARLVISYNRKRNYQKAFFPLKLRSNLKDIYECMKMKYSDKKWLLDKENDVTTLQSLLVESGELEYKKGENVIIEIRDVLRFLLLTNKQCIKQKIDFDEKLNEIDVESILNVLHQQQHSTDKKSFNILIEDLRYYVLCVIESIETIIIRYNWPKWRFGY